MTVVSQQVQSTAADHAFRRARRAAAREVFLARVRGRSTTLLSYDAVMRTFEAQAPRPIGMCDVPMDAIVGSAGRYTDFTPSFRPRHESERTRWTRVYSLMTDPRAGGIPPIDVYRVGEAYFVIDGNHRVSVARTLGATLIRARVTEVETRVPLVPSDDRNTLSIKADYAAFLEQTQLDVTRPGADLLMTVPGKYTLLLDDIRDLRRRLNQFHDCTQITVADAAATWYDRVYLPAVQKIRPHPLLHTVRERTEADVYVWLLEYARARRARCGYNMTAATAADRLLGRHDRTPTRLLSQLARILVGVLRPPEPCADAGSCC